MLLGVLCMCRGTARERVALDKLSKQLKQQLDRYKQIVNDHDKRRATYPLQTPGKYSFQSVHFMNSIIRIVCNLYLLKSFPVVEIP